MNEAGDSRIATDAAVHRLAPVLCAELMGPLNGELVTLLRGLTADDWRRPVTRVWSVREVAAHILDTQVRRVSFQRDRLAPLPPATPIHSFADLVGFLDGLNASWIEATRRMSPALLVELIEHVGDLLPGVFAAVDPEGPALFDVAWAGDEPSPAWLDLARELTEHWHHQQQIRAVVGAPLLLAPRWSGPVLETLLRALPRAYDGLGRPERTALVLRIGEPLGRDYTLRREDATWRLFAGAAAAPAATVEVDAEGAWRILTRGLPPAEALRRLRLTGDRELGERFAQAVAVMVP